MLCTVTASSHMKRACLSLCLPLWLPAWLVKDSLHCYATPGLTPSGSGRKRHYVSEMCQCVLVGQATPHGLLCNSFKILQLVALAERGTIIALASRASGCRLDTQTHKKHSSGHLQFFCEQFLKTFFSYIYNRVFLTPISIL